ncbi:MAG TPA: universal stress protein [Mycobacterium sp.]|nr:universal stress protein [Mycobacterium sp.]
MTIPTSRRGLFVCVDGSPSSHAAVRWAADEAAMRNVGLTLLYGLPSLNASWVGIGMTMAPLPADYSDLLERQGDEVLTEAAAIAVERSPDLDVDRKMFSPPLIATLIEFTKHSDMIVVGSRGQGALARTLLGSVSTALVQHAHCPVAVIHDGGREPAPTAPVLVGVDRSPASEVATAIAFDEASHRGVDLVAVYACSDANFPDFADVDLTTLLGEGELALAERLAGWSERYPDVATRRVVVPDRPAQHLLDETHSAQLVVVGSRGRGGFTGMLLGSVSNAVVHGASIPVIVARRY